MKTFSIHIVIAIALSYLFFDYSSLLPYNAATALLVFLVFILLLWLSAVFYHPSYFRKLPKAMAFLFFFLKEMFVANIKIAYEIITPRYRMQPTVVALPLSARTDVEITLLAAMITLTPGTLSLDVSDDKKILWVHVLYLEEGGAEEIVQKLKWGFERRLLELTT
ncbi:Na+/H+ antiporter subunit E [Cesiribacter sp. SM1]|uniref:Na+/H+ antiporter subunit E n=1 Tax=Cesiribacter sp. SM1 TaxID=2861196 RepID=UPI001CD3D83A|nr:Na+/H+ antiporter subunit E [Cesiribacter sp. SM1]